MSRFAAWGAWPIVLVGAIASCGGSDEDSATGAPISASGGASSSGSSSSSGGGASASSSGGATSASSSSGASTSSSSGTLPTCKADENRCDGGCKPNGPLACGASCVVCPTITNGQPTCLAGACGVSCNGGHNLCGGVCTPNTPLSCGASCAACPTTSNGTATCNAAGACGTTCNAGYVACLTGCCAQKAIALSVGSSHTCAISDAGAAICWGSNQSGVVGNGNLIVKQPTPVEVVGLGTGVTAISASQQTSCAIAGGVVKCWGYNGWEQIPNTQQFFASAFPQDVALGAPASAVVTGTSATCAITTAGVLKCWGEPLGTGAEESGTPTDVASGVAEVVIGYGHGCFRTTGGAAKCWGKGDVGELGNSNQFHSATPVDVTGLSSGVLGLSTSFRYTCALVSGGQVKCWGESDAGQLGPSVAIGSISSKPVPVTLPSAAAQVSAGEGHACAVVAGGAVYCWGAGYGSTPISVVSLSSGVALIGAGGDHSCALMTTGSVKCWGWNGVGELGTGSTTPQSSSTPLTVVAFP